MRTRLGSPHCTSHAQGGGRPDARPRLARFRGPTNWNGSGGRGRRWSSRQSVFYQGPFIRREKGRRKSTEDTALAAQSIGRVAPANKLSDKDRNGFPRQEEDRDSVSQRLIGKWRVYKQGKQDPVAGGFFLAVIHFLCGGDRAVISNDTHPRTREVTWEVGGKSKLQGVL